MRSRLKPAPRAKTALTAHPEWAPIDSAPSFKHQAYSALSTAIAAMDVYRSRHDIRLDERKLAQDFGISRTPVREAMARSSKSVPRRGIYVVRKTQRGNDHRLGGPGKHGGAERSRTGRGDRRLAQDVRHLRGRLSAPRISTNTPRSISSSMILSSA